MRFNRWVTTTAALLLAVVGARTASAQGVTTGAVAGQVTDQAGVPIEGVQVRVVNRSNGFTNGAVTRGDGRYTVFGLEVGDTYAVTARRIGLEAVTRENVRVTLSQTTQLNFALALSAAQLAGVTVTATGDEDIIQPSRTGIGTRVSDSTLRRLPTLNRNFTDFVALTPQISTTLTNGGLSGGGVNNRFNNIQIDGATETDLFGLGSTGQPGGQARGKSIGIESVKEYQVLLAPYDVRQGNFAGVLINAVTKSGTNSFGGTAYYFTRSENLTRSQDYLTDYNQQQYGFTLGGPIVKNKAFFFVNPEFQRRDQPANGYYLGAPNLPATTATFLDASIPRFRTALTGVGYEDVGSAGLVENTNPLSNIFARLDVVLPFNTQLVLRHNYGKAEDDNFGRGATGTSPNFPLSSNAYFFSSVKNATVAQLRTNFDNGAFNELITGYNRIRDARTTPGQRIAQVTALTPNAATLIAGTDRFSQANELDQDIFEITNNFTLPSLGAHRLTIGTQNQFYKVRNLFANSLLGAWTFGSLDSLEAGLANEYIVGVPAMDDGAVRFNSAQLSGYVQDEWAVRPNLNVTLGFRVDAPTFSEQPPENPDILRDFGRSTSAIPSGNLQYSPRVGFNWDVTNDQRNQLRGGVGVFVGRPAFVWLSNAFQNSGLSGVNLLTCSRRGRNNPPAFTADNLANPPAACANGLTARAGSQVDLLNEDLRFPQTLRGSLGFDRNLGRDFIVTLEGLYTRGLNNLFYQNIALAGPAGTDRNGRVVYGDSANAPSLRVPGRSIVLDVENQSEDYSYNLTGGLTRRFVNSFAGSLFYTYTQARDVQSLTSSTGFSQYRFGRAYSGREDAKTVSRSTFEQPHRVIAQGSYAFRTRTDLSVVYIGQSGAPITYVSSGDLNGDGFTLNDPIYVPQTAFDASEITFTTLTGDRRPAAEQIQAQAAALEQFIQDTPCLNDQRGQITSRSSCRAPWQNQVNLTLQQGLPTFRGQNLSVRLDVFNFGNLLNNEWGRSTNTSGVQTLLTYRSKTPGTFQSGSQARFNFREDFEPINYDILDSNYQMQLSLRYSF